MMLPQQLVTFLSKMKTPEICDVCGTAKEMYYVPWCSRCEVPEVKNNPTLNLLQCMRHVERVHFGIEDENDYDARKATGHDEIWSGFCDQGFSNDSTVHLPIVDAAKGDGSIGELSEEAIEYLQTMVKIFDLETQPNVQWEISW